MLPVGTLLQGGKYRIERHLSSGGFGNTYVAINTEFEERVAIKEFFIRGISERDGDSVSVSVSNKTNVEQFTSQKEKFRKEARRLRKLRNSHIVAVHDLFEENGTSYYEMDLINGESLSERMKRTGLPFSEQEVMKILDQVLDALSVVHAQGLYHLDLKPANIMLDQQGCALLIDFGASKQMSAGDGLSVSTSSALAFTPGYAPLEQTEQNLKAFGPWTDLYALGATLYKLLTNLTPPSASEILMMTTPLLFPMPVSARMQQLIAWMMKPRLDERPQSVDAVKQFLAAPPLPAEDQTQPVSPEIEVEETEVVVKPQPKPKEELKHEVVSQLEQYPKPKSRTGLIVAAFFIGLFIVGGIVGGVFFMKNMNSDSTPTPVVATDTVTSRPVAQPQQSAPAAVEQPIKRQTPTTTTAPVKKPASTTTSTPTKRNSSTTQKPHGSKPQSSSSNRMPDYDPDDFIPSI